MQGRLGLVVANKAAAQDWMLDGAWVSHAQETCAFRRTPVGNIEADNGATFNLQEFWYARRGPEFEDGWVLKVSPCQADEK